MRQIYWYFLVLAVLPASFEAAKILALFPQPGPSQYIYGVEFLKGLAEKGHQVTSVSVFPQKKPLKNFRDIAIPNNANLFSDVVDEALGVRKSVFETLRDISAVSDTIVGNVFDNAEFKKLMHDEQFDLVIVEVFLSEALLGLGEHFKAPVIAVTTFGPIHFLDYMMGNPSPLSYIPNLSLQMGNNMCLWERLKNVVFTAFDAFVFDYVMLPIQERLYRKTFPTATLSLDEARKNVSLLLVNNHFTLTFPRPYVSNMIEAGGLQLKQNPDPLPQDIQQILDQAKEGAIYFSLGSNVKSKNLPPEVINNILETFRDLKIPVLWKFEAEALPNKPINVFIRPWFPQPSVLAHPNVKLFISHGGFLSTTETIYFGKPILGIPVFTDQFTNVYRAVEAGYALSLDLHNITKHSLKSTIVELWNNSKYTQKIQKLSRQFRDQPMTPMETAIYWVEYVLRHEGAVHMRNPGVNLNFWQYHNLDVYAILVIVFIIFIILIAMFVLICRNIYNKIMKLRKKSRQAKEKRSERKKNRKSE